MRRFKWYYKLEKSEREAEKGQLGFHESLSLINPNINLVKNWLSYVANLETLWSSNPKWQVVSADVQEKVLILGESRIPKKHFS